MFYWLWVHFTDGGRSYYRSHIPSFEERKRISEQLKNSARNLFYIVLSGFLTVSGMFGFTLYKILFSGPKSH